MEAGRRGFLRNSAALGLAAAGCTTIAPAQPADLVVVNAKVATLNPRQPTAEALAIRGERIAAVGSRGEIEAYRGPATRVVDAGGRTVIPGLNDAHTHFIRGGLTQEMVSQLILTKSFPEGLRRVREHKAAGHRTILITGALSFNVAGLKPLFDEIVAAELAVDGDGRATGRLAAPPLVGEARAAWLRRYASTEGIDLRNSYAYADSYSDLPLLRAVGNPVAVSPDAALLRLARRRRWPIEEWQMAGGMPRVRFPKPAVR